MIRTRLGDLRNDNDYSQQTIANILSVSRRTYSGWENNRLIPIEYLVKLTDLYNVSLDYILYNSNDSVRNYTPKKFDKKQISKNLIMYRKKLNKSQSTIAEDIHVNQSTVSMWENNSINIQIDSLKSLSKVFNISIDKLVGIE